MRCVIFDVVHNDEVKQSYLGEDEFISYIPDETINMYMNYKKLSNYREAKRDFLSDYAENFNDYSPQNNNDYSCEIKAVVNNRRLVPMNIRNEDLDEYRLNYAEYALSNFNNSVPTMEKISEELRKNPELPIKYLVNQQAILTVREEKRAIIREQSAETDKGYLEILDSNTKRR